MLITRGFGHHLMHRINLLLQVPIILNRKGSDILLKINFMSTLFVGIDVSSKPNAVYAMDFYKNNYIHSSFSNNQPGDFDVEDTHMQKVGNAYLRYYLGEAANSVRRHAPEYRDYYAKKYSEVTKHQHNRALALTSRKFVRLVFGLLVKNQL